MYPWRYVISVVDGNAKEHSTGCYCGFRIAGPKPWGGGKIIQTFRISSTDTRALDALQAAIDTARGKTAKKATKKAEK